MKLPIEKAKKAGRGTSYMSVQALQGMRDHADELLNVITADTMLPDWAEFKIARASQSLTSVFEYMNHGEGALKQAKTAEDAFGVRVNGKFWVATIKSRSDVTIEGPGVDERGSLSRQGKFKDFQKVPDAVLRRFESEVKKHGVQAKTAKVDIRPLRGKVRFYVLQAQGNHFKAKEIPAKASNFWARVGKVIDNVRDENGNLIFYGMDSRPDDVVVECTRGGMAFSIRFEAQYNEPDLDIFDHLKALKKAFIAEGIAF